MTERHGRERDDRLPTDERDAQETIAGDPMGRRVPSVGGPNAAPSPASGLPEDPDADGDGRGETGAVGGAIAGTGAAGPLGGMVGAVQGGAAGAAVEGEDHEMVEAHANADAEAPADSSQRR